MDPQQAWWDYCVRHVEEARASARSRRKFKRLLKNRTAEFFQQHNLPADYEGPYVPERDAPSPGSWTPAPPVLANGVGTALKGLLADLGVEAVSGCGCNDYAAQLNLWNVEGVQARREEIISWLKKNYKEQSWATVYKAIKASALAGWTGQGFVPNPLDVFGSLVDEACRRAEAHGKGDGTGLP